MIECKKEAIEKDRVDEWFHQWLTLEKKIHATHSKRENAKAYMLEAILLYEGFIIQASKTSEQQLINETYEVLPINGLERLAFIKNRPGQYACYRQLDELFGETKKRCARLRLKYAK